jgi:Uma2 family endonuclease
MLSSHLDRVGEEYWRGADLVMEVVSGSDEDRYRDLVEKRREYAKARIAEYWIVDPLKATITVLRLGKGRYVVEGEHGKGQTAKSRLLDGFAVSVNEVFQTKTANGARR